MMWGVLGLLGTVTAFAVGGPVQAALVVVVSIVALWLVRARKPVTPAATGKERVR